MASIVESGRFIAAHHLPVRPLWISGSQACAVMSSAKIGALVATDGEQPTHLVSAAFLRVAIRTAAQEIGERAATIVPLSGHLIEYWKPSSSLAAAVAAQFQADGLADEYAVAVIADLSLAIDAPEPQERKFELLSVRGSAGLSVGWYIGHERLMGVIQTPPPVWYCEPYDHSNGDPDTGKCHQCGGPLKL